MSFNNPGRHILRGFTDCLICGQTIVDTTTAARNHLTRCDAFGSAR